MKNITIALMITAVLLFTACGGGGGGGDTDNKNISVDMQKNTLYAMKAGEVIVKTQKDTVIELETDIKTGVTTAKLIKGGAKIE